VSSVDDLADDVASTEGQEPPTLRENRRGIKEAIERRYTSPA